MASPSSSEVSRAAECSAISSRHVVVAPLTGMARSARQPPAAYPNDAVYPVQFSIQMDFRMDSLGSLEKSSPGLDSTFAGGGFLDTNGRGLSLAGLLQSQRCSAAGCHCNKKLVKKCHM